MSYTRAVTPLLQSYATRGTLGAVYAPLNEQLAVVLVKAINGRSSPQDVGIVRRFATATLKFFTYNGTVYTDVTSTLLLGGAVGAIPTTTGRGFVVQSKKQSGLLGFNVSTATASGDISVQYWNGSTWSTLTTISSANYQATGVAYVAFIPPSDWMPGGGGLLDPSMYSIRVLAGAAAPATQVAFNSFWAGQMIDFQTDVPAYTALADEFEHEHPFTLDSGEAIMPYFEVADAANSILVAFSYSR